MGHQRLCGMVHGVGSEDRRTTPGNPINGAVTTRDPSAANERHEGGTGGSRHRPTQISR